MKRVSVALAFIVLASACAGSNELSGDRRVVGVVNQLFTIRPARVEVGKLVTFTMRVSNTSGQPQKVRYPSGQRYDFWVTKGSTVVWRWSTGQFFTQDVSTRTLAPLESAAFTETWKPTRSGSYIAHAELKADGFSGFALKGPLKVGG